jgi:hypothetical protein
MRDFRSFGGTVEVFWDGMRRHISQEQIFEGPASNIPYKF